MKRVKMAGVSPAGNKQMQALLVFRCLVLAPALSSAAPTLIDSITTDPGLTSPTTFTNVDQMLKSITVGSTTYGSLSAASSVTGNTGTEYLWGSAVEATNPGNVATAVTDLNITTGSLNTGANTIYGFDSVNAFTTFFAFGNYGGDNPVSVTAVNGLGNAITDALALPSFTKTVASITVNRSSTTGTLDRTIRGVVFGATDFAFTGGSAADIAGIKFGSSNFDVQDVGIAAIPEPTLTAAFLGISIVGMAIRRRLSRKRNP